MKTTLTIITVLLCTLHFNGQNQSTERLKTTLDWLEAQVQSPKDSTNLLIKTREAINLSNTLNDEISLGKSYRYLATFHKEYSSLDSSLHYLNLAKDIFSENSNAIELANTHLYLKSYYTATADYNKAKSNVYKALEIFESKNHKKGIANCYAHIGDLLYYENNYNEAVDYCNKAIAIQKEIGDEIALARSYRYKANSLLFTGFDLDEALVSINKSISIYEKLGEDGIPIMAAINWRGNIYKYMDRFEEAIADYQANFDNSKKMGLERYLIPSLGNIGHVYVMQGKYAEALPYNLEAIELIKKTGRTRNLWENYMHVAEIYESLGDYKNALYYHQLFASEQEAFKDNIILGLEQEAQSKYEVGQKNAKILFQEEKIDQQQKTKVLYIVLSGLLLLIVFGLLYNYRKRKMRNEQLLALNQELDKRNKQNELLLKEIHHRVKNNLELVKSLIALQSDQLEDSITKNAMIASQNRVQSMGIIHQKLYQGENLGSIDMKDYFINLKDGILDTFNIEDNIKIECAMQNLELDVDTAVPIGLIVNELLTNALKYAFPDDRKGKIEISMDRPNSETLTLKVVDDGIGKTKVEKPQGTGFGTQLIKLLTQQLNGNMTETFQGGTSVEFEFKIKEAA